jgi:hypothetical protein
MNVYVVGAYVAYLTISISLTVWVARTLVKNGRIFLVDSFLGNESLADSVNHLLAVGFYLVNVGYVSLALKYGDKPLDLAQAIETLSTKVGLVLLVLGAMHFLNLFIFSRMRRREPEAAGPGRAVRRAGAGVEPLTRSKRHESHRLTVARERRRSSTADGPVDISPSPTASCVHTEDLNPWNAFIFSTMRSADCVAGPSGG